MTLEQYIKKNESALLDSWNKHEQDNYANFESFAFVEWQKEGNCDVK